MARETREREDVRKKLTNVHGMYRVVGAKKLGIFKPKKKWGLVVNLGKQGFDMRITEPVEVDSELELHVELPGAGEPLGLHAKVQWIKEERKIGTVTYTHVIGARFLELSPEVWRAILKILGEEQ